MLVWLSVVTGMIVFMAFILFVIQIMDMINYALTKETSIS